MTPVPASPPAKQTQKRSSGCMLRTVIWIVLLVLAGLGVYLIFGPKKAAPAAGPGRGGGGMVTVTTVTATKGDIGDYIKRIGNVVPVHTAVISSQVTGVVKTVNYKEGQYVNEGDPLVDVDASQYEATLMQAEGTLEKDQGVLAQAQMDLQRYEAAWKLNAVSKQILDDQRQLVEQVKGTVKNDQGTVNFDQIQVDYCHTKAPFTGRVGLRLVDPGNLVTAGASANPLAVITQMQPITVVFSIPEGNNDLGAVMEQLKNNATLAADVYDSTDTKKLASGEFTAMDSQIDTTTGTVKVRATFSNDDLALFPNQFVNVHLLVKTLQGATLIPTAAIQQNGQTSFVYLIQDNVAHVHNIKPGVVDDKSGLTQVDGIEPGDVVANSSFDKLQEGSKVAVDTGKPSTGKGGKPSGAQSGTSSDTGDGASPSPHHKRVQGGDASSGT